MRTAKHRRSIFGKHGVVPVQPSIDQNGYYRFHSKTYDPVAQAPISMPQGLTADAARIAGWRVDSWDVYCYFDNDEAVHSIFNAQDLIPQLG